MSDKPLGPIDLQGRLTEKEMRHVITTTLGLIDLIQSEKWTQAQLLEFNRQITHYTAHGASLGERSEILAFFLTKSLAQHHALFEIMFKDPGAFIEAYMKQGKAETVH